MKILWDGFDDLAAKLIAKVRPQMALEAEEIGRLMLEGIKKILEVPPQRSGRFYPSRARMGFVVGSKGGNKRRAQIVLHRASAPGEAPAPDTRDYKDSFDYRIVRSGFGLDVELVSTLWERFGRRLEFGGYGRGGYIAPRPHVRVLMMKMGKFRTSGLPATAWSSL